MKGTPFHKASPKKVIPRLDADIDYSVDVLNKEKCEKGDSKCNAEQILRILFEGREEILKIIDDGGNILKYVLNEDNKVCRLLNSDIKMGQQLGSGVKGKVFEIQFEDANYAGKYVVKKTKIETDTIKTKQKDIGKLYSNILLNLLGPANTKAILEYNKLGSEDKVKSDGEIIVVPEYLINKCMGEITYQKLDSKELLDIPEGSIICENYQTEFLISVLTAELYRKSISINMLDSFYISTCRDKNEIKQYIFMESIDKTLFQIIKNKQNSKYILGIYLQIVHAIATYQKYLRVVHGDLHEDNVFLKSRDTVLWNGEPISNANYFEYVIGKQKLFLNAKDTPYIVKIGDWGLSVLYGPTKIIGDMETIKTGYDQNDGKGPWLPNFYNAAYDLVFITARILHHTGDVYIRKILMWMLGSEKEDEFVTMYDKIFRKGTIRPSISSLETTFAHVTPEALLQNEILMSQFLNKPKGEGIGIVIGKI